MQDSYWINPEGAVIYAPKGHQVYIQEHWQEHDLPADIALSNLIIQGWVRVSSDNVILRQVENPEVLSNLKQLLLTLGYDKYVFWVSGKPYTVPLGMIESSPIVDIYRDMLAGKLEYVADAFDQGIFETQPSWGESESAGSIGMKDRGTEFMPQDYTKEVWWARDLLDYLRKNFPGKKDVMPPEDDNGFPTQASDVIERMIKKAERFKISGEELRRLWGNGETIEANGTKYTVHRMSYGEYFLQPEGWVGGERDGFAPGTKWLSRINSRQDMWGITGEDEVAEAPSEIVRNHNSGDKEIPEDLLSIAVQTLKDAMGVDVTFARQLVRSYNFHTAVNEESVIILNSLLDISGETEEQGKTRRWEERWRRRGGIEVQAEVYGNKINKLQQWTDAGKPVPKSYSGHNARYELDRDYILHLYHYSTEIVTADMKNRVILKVTTGGHYSVSTKARIRQILYAFRGIGYPSVRLVRYEYDASESEADRDAEETKIEEQDREWRNQQSRERYKRNVVQRREMKRLQELYPKEIEELKSGDYGYTSHINEQAILIHLKNKEEEKKLQEQYPEDYNEYIKGGNKGRGYVRPEDLEKFREEKKTREWEQRWTRRKAMRLKDNIKVAIV